MKLPPIVRKLRKLSFYQISFTLFIIAMLSPASQAYLVGSSMNSMNANSGLNANQNTVTTITITDSSIRTDVRPEETGAQYLPIIESTDDGNNFVADDNLAVDHQFTMNLTEDSGLYTNSFSISNISDYTADNLQYNITDITAIKDYYVVEDQTSGVREKLTWYESVALAQEFKVEWDYAVFSGAKILLNYIVNVIAGNYELEILLVNASTSNPYGPNMTSVLSTDVNDPYDSVNTPPVGTSSNIRFFDFTDVVLEKGSYYIVANLTIVDNNDETTYDYFAWDKYVGTPYGGKTFEMDNATRTWAEQTTYDLTLLPELLASDVTGLPLTFTDPNVIDLQDNSTAVTSLTSIISSTGIHTLTSNTSVQITFDNNYEFVKSYSAAATFQVTNSSYWDYSVSWNLTWVTPELDTSPYLNLDRYQLIYTPTDWNSTIFSIYFNNTNLMTTIREIDGYKLVLDSNSSVGDWKLSTSSPNYISSLALSDDIAQAERYFLGYWIGDVADSTGYSGSNITAETTVQSDGDTVPINEITGSLNYTLYDANGQIVPNKGTLLGPQIYTDTSSYTLNGITNSSAGYYQSTITFDPSVNGSDLAGFWTAAVFWQNGTEAGYYSLRIVVQTQTMFEYEWETEPGNDIWTTSDISRKGLDSINVSTYYYNISESYFFGQRNIMPDAVVSYNFHNSTWSDSGFLTQTDEFFGIVYNLGAGVDVGVYTFDMVATGAFIENLTASFDVTIFYELALIPEYTDFQTNYTNNLLYYINLYDVTASSNLSLTPDDMIVTITNGTDFPLSSPVDYNFTYQASTEQWILDISTSTNDLDTGLYSLEIAIHLNNYQANYTDVYVSDVYTFEITAPKTSIQKIDDATTIYLYHDVTYSFRFLDTNHSIALLGANVVASANVSNIAFSYNVIGDTYYVTVTNNNPEVSSIGINVDVSLSNYESITNFLLGELSVLTIQTSLTEDTTPTEVYVGYNHFIIVQFNDITHTELIADGTGSFVTITSNSSSFNDTLGYIYIGSGKYNVSFINDDSTLEGINITITIGKTGYENASISLLIQVVSISTDAMLVDSADENITIFYDEGASIEILYWDNISFVNITNPQISYSGNLTLVVIPTDSFLDNITTITILTILDIGYYQLIITLEEPGYEPQIIIIYIRVLERQTSVDSDSTDVTFYADLTDQVLLNYTDELDIVEILAANVSVDFAVVNSTLSMQDYFIITIIPVGSLYEITFDPIEMNATGYVFLFNITLSKYGYETDFIIITVTIDIHPTAIDPSSETEESVYIDVDGQYTIIYETTGDTFIAGADLSYVLLNGTAEEILDVTLAQVGNTYVVTVSINSSIVPIQSFEISLTFYKDGFENQTFSITITVINRPTAINPSSDNEDSVYTDEDGEYTIIYYDTNTSLFIGGADLSYVLLNGTAEDILDVTFAQVGNTYVVTVSINSSIVPIQSFDLNLTFYKNGYENQTYGIRITVINHPTAIDPSSDNEDSVYTDEDGEYTIIYETDDDDTFIAGAELSYVLLNGTSSEILDVTFAQAGSTYVVTVSINSSIVPVKSFEIELTFYKHGYENQTLIITITVSIHPTAIDPSSDTETTINTEENGEFTIIYETVEDDFIDSAEFSYSTNGTSSEILDVVLTPIVDAYVVYVYINSSIVPVKSFEIELTFYKHGYENQTLIITITVSIHPTAIDPSSDTVDSVYTDEDGAFTIIYETVEDDFIDSAEFSYVLLNGTSSEILDVVLTPIFDAYVVYVYINSSIDPVTSFEIELTFYKHGYENQTLIITITVSTHLTAIDSTSENQDTIYADEDSEFIIIYESIEDDFIPGADMDYNIVNGTSAEILDVAYSQRTDYYVITVYFNESLIAGNNYTIELIFSKHGFETQTWIINIVVYEKIVYEIDVEIVGTVQQLNTIQFQISLANLSLADLQALSSVDIKYAPSPVGDFVTIEYTFVFANGTRVTRTIQVEIGSDYTGLSEEIYIPWMVGEIFYTVTYEPTNGAVIESKTVSDNPALYPISPDFATLMTYFFQEFTVYMIVGLALVAILFISLTVYFAVIRPKKQRKSAKKKRYLDKISKVLTSVLSLRKIIVVHNETGLPIYEWDLGETMTVDSSLVSGFLQAVSGMGGEISGGEAQAVRKIDYGQFCVSSSSTDDLTTYLFSTGDISVDVEEGLSSFIKWFAKKFQGTLEGQWDGVTDVFEQASRVIIDRLSEDLFIWTLHPLSVNPMKEQDVAKLDSFSQKLYKFIKDYKEVSISVALEYFNKSPIEVTLTKLFELVDNTFLLRKRLR